VIREHRIGGHGPDSITRTLAVARHLVHEHTLFLHPVQRGFEVGTSLATVQDEEAPEVVLIQPCNMCWIKAVIPSNSQRMSLGSKSRRDIDVPVGKVHELGDGIEDVAGRYMFKDFATDNDVGGTA
jgi:hypothetical protein